MIITVINRGKLEFIADHYGLKHQAAKAAEEADELIGELCKDDADLTDNPDGVIEEIADNVIMIGQLIYKLKCQDKVADMIDFKLKRQMQRIAEEDKT